MATEMTGSYSLSQKFESKLARCNKHDLPPLPLAGEGWGGGICLWTSDMSEEAKPEWKVPRRLRANARALRKNSTDAERVLWTALRNHRLSGFAFRRQVPIENFIADFVCNEAGLIIELDGGQHFTDETKRKDVARSTVLESNGFRVLRFSNRDVMTNRDGVLETIAAALEARAPSPTLPRKREKGQAVPAEKTTS